MDRTDIEIGLFAAGMLAATIGVMLAFGFLMKWY